VNELVGPNHTFPFTVGGDPTIHHETNPPDGVKDTSPKPDAVIVTPLYVTEDPICGNELTVAHIGQTGVGVGVGGNVVGVGVGVTTSQG
jgi:hypothetical protein